MTWREAYTALLMELNKVSAPSIHLEEYNYFGNKGVQEYTNERATLYNSSGQLTDDLQALYNSATGKVIKTITNNIPSYTVNYTGSITDTKNAAVGKKFGSSFLTCLLPDNYFRYLAGDCNIKTLFSYKCWGAGYVHNNPLKRLPADIHAGVMNNSFLKPGFRNPYYMIVDGDDGGVVGNLQLFIGDYNKFEVSDFTIDYLKQPSTYTLTSVQAAGIVDNSQLMEFPEYACNEIVKRITKLVLENSTDPRLQTNPLINNTIQ